MPIQEIADQLHRLNKLHEELLKLGEHKRAILVVNKVDELTKIVNQENKLVKQVTECEAAWLEASKQFLVSKGVKPDASITMTGLLRLVFNPQEKQMLKGLQDQLLDTLDKLKALNAFNQQLIVQSLSFINHSLDIMTGAPEDEMVYKHPSQEKSGTRRGMFDTKA